MKISFALKEMGVSDDVRGRSHSEGDERKYGEIDARCFLVQRNENFAKRVRFLQERRGGNNVHNKVRSRT